MEEKNSERYSGVGFAEALIALMVAGLVAVVLMRISANAIGDLARLDLEDEIARRAVSAAVDIQNAAISESQKDPDDNIFYDPGSILIEDQCYEYSFNVDGEILFDYVGDLNEDPPYERKPISNDPDEEDFIRVVCVTYHESDDRSKMVVKIFTGVVGMAGLNTTDNDIKDYAYYSVINL